MSELGAMDKRARIFVSGHRGLVGASLLRRLTFLGYSNLVTRTHSELDLTHFNAVDSFFQREKIDYVFLAAAKVGGIHANDSFPADFIRDNLQIQTNSIDAAWRHGVKKFLYLGSSCIYPKHAPQPMKEDYILTGPLEPTNEPYAIAKIAGLKMCQAYRKQYSFNAIAAMPTNLYGPGDNFSFSNSHVLPALMRKCYQAKLQGEKDVVVWGSGTPRREFLFVDDLADACIFLMQHYNDPGIVNIGWGVDISIAELASTIAEIVGFHGNIIYDTGKPDGTPRKLLDTSRLASLGWRPSVPLREGVAATFEWFVANEQHLRI